MPAAVCQPRGFILRPLRRGRVAQAARGSIFGERALYPSAGPPRRTHSGIHAALLQQLRVRAALGDLSPFQHDDLVGALHGGQAVGDDDGRPALGKLGKRGLDLAYGEVIEGAGRLV